MKLTHAIILSAGLGTRMRPLTDTLPKPLIPVNGVPLIDYSLRWLVRGGITDVVINTSYRAAQLEDYLAQYSSPRICFSREEPAPLETGGGVAKALPLLSNGPFLAMNSDAIFPPTFQHPITRMCEAWSDDLDFLMLLVPKSQAIGWQGQGDFIVDNGGRIRRPLAGEAAPYIFTGVEIIHPRAFDGCPHGAFSLSKLWNKRIETDGYFSRMYAIIHEGKWLNVGDLAGLKAAEDYSGGASIG